MHPSEHDDDVIDPLEVRVREYFRAEFTKMCPDAMVIYLSPEHWRTTELGREDNNAHVPYGFRAPRYQSERVYVMICPALVAQTLEGETEAEILVYMLCWLNHLGAHIEAGLFSGPNLEERIEDELWDLSPGAAATMARLQLKTLDLQSTKG